MLELSANFPTAADFLTAYDGEMSRKGLLVRGASVEAASPMAPCRVALVVEGTPVLSLEAKLAAVVPNVGVAVMLDALPPELVALADRARAGQPLLDAPDEEAAEEAPTGPISERLKAMTVPQKMSLALNCDRETRFALLRDSNKALHLYVLRNPRIGIDEVQAAAKMASLSPDALKFIAEHREWGNSSTICTALVRNPKMLLPIALRLLDKIPASEVRAIAKGGARDQVVQAARKKLSS